MGQQLLQLLLGLLLVQHILLLHVVVVVLLRELLLLIEGEGLVGSVVGYLLGQTYQSSVSGLRVKHVRGLYFRTYQLLALLLPLAFKIGLNRRKEEEVFGWKFG